MPTAPKRTSLSASGDERTLQMRLSRLLPGSPGGSFTFNTVERGWIKVFFIFADVFVTIDKGSAQ